MRRQLLVWESSLEKQFDIPITVLCAYSEANIKQLNNFSMRVLAIRKQHNKIMTI